MFNLNDTMRYFLCPGRTDMRKGAVLTPAIRTSFPMIRLFHWICVAGAISRQARVAT